MSYDRIANPPQYSAEYATEISRRDLHIRYPEQRATIGEMTGLVSVTCLMWLGIARGLGLVFHK